MMRCTALFGLLLATASPALAEDPSPYPGLAILDAFKTGCGAIEDQAAASSSLTAAGWDVSNPDFRPGPLTDFLAFAQEAGGEAVRAQGGTMSDMEVFEREIEGERVFVVLSEVRIDGTRVTGCRLFDFGETRKIGIETARGWIGREPVKTINKDGVIIADWEPGTTPGHDSFQLFFIPADSPLKQATYFDGVALKSDTVGVSDE
ncbi:MAG: hypothetical protein AAFR88_02085 [Pseudomonadota bacterium]